MELLRNNPSTTYRQAANALSVSYTTVWRTLRAMQEAGFIERTGSDRRGTWRILTPHQTSHE
ncbi:winged helix-turn-helix domain-containing protein [Bifidobacterium sp. LC6]|uniref:Winged helix-turn-helix domain-containing protein n=1 Tax=Bifidobacterium colobi TaxID=2809026 RepID=A0ABS5UTN6_9BIFI|nr:winged helix-turn-helix domain-containing protein [Bifidobacterium colobi]